MASEIDCLRMDLLTWSYLPTSIRLRDVTAHTNTSMRVTAHSVSEQLHDQSEYPVLVLQVDILRIPHSSSVNPRLTMYATPPFGGLRPTNPELDHTELMRHRNFEREWISLLWSYPSTSYAVAVPLTWPPYLRLLYQPQVVSEGDGSDSAPHTVANYLPFISAWLGDPSAHTSLTGFRTGLPLAVPYYVPILKDAVSYISFMSTSTPPNSNPLLRYGISQEPTGEEQVGQKRSRAVSALTLGPRKKPERRELRVFRKLLAMIPGFEDRLMSSDSEEELMFVANMLQRGSSSARSDDTKSLKGAIVDWITPTGGHLDPPLARNVKINRGFNHDRTGFLLCPAELDWQDEGVKNQLRNKEIAIAGSHWPIFVYKNEVYDCENPWKGLFRNEILVKAFKHIFTSPSSVEDEPKATRSGNARLHGMTHVTPGSLAYVFTQVRFALTSASVFSRTDRETDSETFYTSVLELLEDPEEQDQVRPLLLWWNQRIFPSFSTTRRLAPANSVLSRIKHKRMTAGNNSNNDASAPSTGAVGSHINTVG
ncbi:hypothetical protein NMY22_g4650 [Coprinellus aureogranulatus]|nr:hypothetical protein NMY22_g4650 [Coprinellus aureogranulatus]